MEKLLTILNETNNKVDYTTCTTLVDDDIFDSFDVVSLINEISSEFDIVIPPEEIAPDNFNSADCIWRMIQRLQDEE